MLPRDGLETETHDGATRSRTVTWQDPLATAASIKQLNGIDSIRAVIDGVLPTPPLERLLQFSFTEVGHGWGEGHLFTR